MSDTLVIWLSDDLAGPWAWYRSEDAAGFVQTDAQKQDLTDGVGRGVNVVISGQAVRIFPHDLPEMRQSERRNAAGFVIEDKLAAAPDDQHIVLDDQAGFMAVISRDKMTEISQVLGEFGMYPSHIYADFDVVPQTHDMVHLSDRYIKPGKSGYTLDKSWMEAEEAPAEIDIHSVLATLQFDPAINLASNEFAPRNPAHFSFAGFKRVAALLAVLGLSWTVWQGTQIRSLKTQTANIKSDARQVYKSVTGKEVENPARAVSRAVKNQPKSSGRFLDLSSLLFAQLQNFDGIEIESLRYDMSAQALNLRLIYPDFEIASRLEQALRSAGMEFTSGGVREQNGAMIGQAVIRLERS